MGFFHELILEALHIREMERTGPPAIHDDDEFDYSDFEPNSQNESDEIPPAPAKTTKGKKRIRKPLTDLEQRLIVFFNRGLERVEKLRESDTKGARSRKKKDPFAREKGRQTFELPDFLDGTRKLVKTPLFTTNAAVPALSFDFSENCSEDEISKHTERYFLVNEVGNFLSHAIDTLDKSLNAQWLPEYGPQAETVSDALWVIRLCYSLSHCIDNRDWLAAISCAIGLAEAGVRLGLRKHEYEFMAGKKALPHNRKNAAVKKQKAIELASKYDKIISELIDEQKRNGQPLNYHTAVIQAIEIMKILEGIERTPRSVKSMVPNRWTTGQRGRRPNK